MYACVRIAREKEKCMLACIYSIMCRHWPDNYVHVRMCVSLWRSDAVVDPGPNLLEHTHSSSKHTQSGQTKSCV